MIRTKSFKSLLGALSALAMAAQVHAVPITGTISYISATTPNNADLTLVTGFSFNPVGIVVSASGDLATIPFVANAPAISDLPLGLGPASASVPVPSLWTGGDFTFDLESLTIDFRSATQFTASGLGTITHPDFDPTPGTWTLAITGTGHVLGLAAGSQAVQKVPDAGSTALCAGIGLVSLALYRRKKG